MLTKLEKQAFLCLKKSIPRLKYNSLAKLGFFLAKPKILKNGLVAIVCAGTSDLPVAEEAAVTLQVLGNRVKKFMMLVWQACIA